MLTDANLRASRQRPSGFARRAAALAEEVLLLTTARRFLIALVVIRFLPFPLGYLPGTERLGNLVEMARSALVAVVSEQLLGHPVEAGGGAGSGDTTHDYVALGCECVLALMLAVAWPRAARRWPRLALLSRAKRPYLRYALAATLLTYGVAKVLPIQFPAPSWAMLTQSYGESSPMRLLWMFMGYSRPYAIASGAVEILAGVLLLFEWTTGLGALLAFGAMSNVVLLNFCYDVPVKIASTTYLQTAIVLLGPHAARAGRALWAARPTIAWDSRKQRALTVARAVAIIGVLYIGVLPVLGELSGRAAHSPWAGFYEVTCYEGADGASAWDRVEITAQAVHARFADGRRERYLLGGGSGRAVDARRAHEDGTSEQVQLEPTRAEDGSVVLTLRERGREVRACLRPTPAPDFLLTRRGFHWINEFPFNH